MRSFSDLFLLMIPGLLGLVLLAFFAVPMHASGLPLAPNVGLVLTLVLSAIFPPAWPRWFVFLFGLLQDVMFGTPLGSQALLLLLLVGLVERLSQRGMTPPFRVRWIEACGLILLWHLLLWIVGHFVSHDFVSLPTLLHTALASALWYPVFYFLMRSWALLLK